MNVIVKVAAACGPWKEHERDEGRWYIGKGRGGKSGFITNEDRLRISFPSR